MVVLIPRLYSNPFKSCNLLTFGKATIRDYRKMGEKKNTKDVAQYRAFILETNVCLDVIKRFSFHSQELITVSLLRDILNQSIVQIITRLTSYAPRVIL